VLSYDNDRSNYAYDSHSSRDRDLSYDNSAADSPSFDMLASTYDDFDAQRVIDDMASIFDIETEVARFGGSRRDNHAVAPSPRWDSRQPGTNTAAFKWNPDRSVTMSLKLNNERRTGFQL
jgi:hypothetical protein